MQARHFAALLCLPLLSLSACMPQPMSAAGSRNPVYSTDMAGKAATCTVLPVTLEDGKDVTTTLTTGGGGWCGILLRRGDVPYGAGLLVQEPRNGGVYVHTVGDDTRVDYIARAGTSGPDSFAVKFIPGDATMRVTVTNTAAPVAAAAPAAAKSATPAKAAPARTTRSRTAK